MSSQVQCLSVSAPWLMAHPVVTEVEPVSGNHAFDYRPDLEPSNAARDMELARRFVREFE